MLQIGSERTDEFVVEGLLTTDVAGTIEVTVLSTPGMIGMMERTAASLAFEQLPAGKATVGFAVNIKHVAGALEGATCTATARITEVVEDRKVHFAVEVKDGERTVGVGTHERRVIDVAGHAASAGS
jgi:fluoroacetyl-CoA thioesterase